MDDLFSSRLNVKGLGSPARGVYMRKGGHLRWEGVVRSLQVGEELPLYVGGRFALGLQGHAHYLRLGDAGTITLYGAEQPPGWFDKLSLAERFEYLGKGPFDLPAMSFKVEGSEKELSEQGLAWSRTPSSADGLVCSTPERAMLELCDGVSNATLIYEVDALMQAMTTLRRLADRLRVRPLQLQVQWSAGEGAGVTRLVASRGRARVQIETTPVMRGAVRPVRNMVVRPRVEEAFGFASVQVLDFADLYAGKLAAALSRQHPRDLFDIGLLLEDERADQKLWQTFLVYLTCSPKPAWENVGASSACGLCGDFRSPLQGHDS
jgi:hypothetical protein